MSKQNLIYGLAAGALLLVAAHVLRVAADERQALGVTAHIASVNALFSGLGPCDVPGLRERVISSGNNTLAYAGEFTPVPATTWVTGPTRIYLYVISGTGVFRSNDVATPVRAGDFVVIPKGARHAVNATSTPMRALYVEDRS